MRARLQPSDQAPRAIALEGPRQPSCGSDTRCYRAPTDLGILGGMTDVGTDTPERLKGIAFNQVPQSQNAIHGDDVAKEHGFAGGLVPGVTVSAYLLDPAVRAWGLDFLARGCARVVLRRPLYDGGAFTTEVEAQGARRYAATVANAQGQACAEGQVELPGVPERAPVFRGDPRLDRSAPPPLGTRALFERLRDEGMCSVAARWDASHDMATYFRDVQAMPPLLRPAEGGYANPGFLLGTTNWVLAANARLPAWLHVQTDSQFFAPVPLGSLLIIEAEVADLFERGGHSFVDVDVAAYQREDESCVMRARLRAIYRLRSRDT